MNEHDHPIDPENSLPPESDTSTSQAVEPQPAEPPLARVVRGLRELRQWSDSDDLLTHFLEYVADLGIELYPAQEEAILEQMAGQHVILATPTGSGKSLVALALHLQAMVEGKRSFYTAPTKALVNEKFFALCDAFGADQVGLLTGDASVNRSASIICCTAEVLSNMALREDNLAVGYVVMDEFHYYGDRDRGVAWQIPLITMAQTQFLLMSASLGDTSDIARRLEDFTGRKVAQVFSKDRPVPLEFLYRETPLQETVEHLLDHSGAPIYLVNFTRRSCAEQAQNLMSINVTTKDEKKRIGDQLADAVFDTPYGKEFQRFIRHGIGVHHGGLLPKYRRVVERLSQSGLIKVISGTDTLGVGVNIPIRSVVLRQLFKFDGQKTALLTARDFHQISGRAGRKGFDDQGTVVVQAPEWIIENRKIAEKIAVQPHLKKKLRKKRPPTGSVIWDETTFRKIVAAQPEPLEPQFHVDYGMLVNLLSSQSTRVGGGYRRLVELVSRAHMRRSEKSAVLRHAKRLLCDLMEAGIVELRSNPNRQGRIVVVHEALQKDFSLHQSLSVYLLQALDALTGDRPTGANEPTGQGSTQQTPGGEATTNDGESTDGESTDGKSTDGESTDGESTDGESTDGESTTNGPATEKPAAVHGSLALDILSLVESILEDPRDVLYRQVNRLRGDLVARLKAEGVEYEERMEQLEKVEYPKPNADFIYATFNTFAKTRPWLEDENIHPKSVAREMYEGYFAFNDYVRLYGLERSEGILLRYLSQVYKTAVQSVPSSYWNEDFEDILAFLHDLVRRTDDSLIQEWGLLLETPDQALDETAEEAAVIHPLVPDGSPDPAATSAQWAAVDPTTHPRAFAARVRNELHLLLKTLVQRKIEDALQLIYDPDQRWDSERLEQAMGACMADYGEVDLAPAARQAHNTILRRTSKGEWIAQQKILSMDGQDDWMLDCIVDLIHPRDPNLPLITLQRIGT
ncbi:MAG: DUF3516 domain-containing protein [Deltaproteobacteria bacterium]|nr:DUF3516 domain-containing protein [Deltaproteobacteria bacterium]